MKSDFGLSCMPGKMERLTCNWNKNLHQEGTKAVCNLKAPPWHACLEFCSLHMPYWKLNQNEFIKSALLRVLQRRVFAQYGSFFERLWLLRPWNFGLFRGLNPSFPILMLWVFFAQPLNDWWTGNSLHFWFQRVYMDSSHKSFPIASTWFTVLSLMWNSKMFSNGKSLSCTIIWVLVTVYFPEGCSRMNESCLKLRIVTEGP